MRFSRPTCRGNCTGATLLVRGMMTQNCVVCTAPTATVHAIALKALRSKTRVGEAAQYWR